MQKGRNAAMRKLKIILSGAIFLSACLYLSVADNIPFWREDFSNTEKKNELYAPAQWKLNAIKPGVAPTSFYVVKDNELKSNKLVVEADKASGGLVCNPSKEVDLNKTPI